MRPILLMTTLLACGCASAPPGPQYDAVRQVVPAGPAADRIRAAFGVELYGPWGEVELAAVEEALRMFPTRDFSGIGFYRLPLADEKGARYDSGKVGVFEVIPDVLVHELAHAAHARAPGQEGLARELRTALDFSMYSRPSSWDDGSRGPRAGFVSPYAARNVNECVAETLTAVKLLAWWGRGPLPDADWSDPRFERVYGILEAHSLLGDEEREALRRLRRRK